ncbi:MAG: hypothetical protein JXR96_24325 [Deltaproteobacteria bacterium]|nr:hypothetical protein [Deltaproteobacteria bacterium]
MRPAIIGTWLVALCTSAPARAQTSKVDVLLLSNQYKLYMTEADKSVRKFVGIIAKDRGSCDEVLFSAQEVLNQFKEENTRLGWTIEEIQNRMDKKDVKRAVQKSFKELARKWAQMQSRTQRSARLIRRYSRRCPSQGHRMFTLLAELLKEISHYYNRIHEKDTGKRMRSRDKMRRDSDGEPRLRHDTEKGPRLKRDADKEPKLKRDKD